MKIEVPQSAKMLKSTTNNIICLVNKHFSSIEKRPV